MRITQRWRAVLAAVAVGSTGLSGCQTWVGGMTLPSGYYLRHTPQYFSPDPTFPLAREQASMEDPVGAAARAGAVGIPPAPIAPAPPVPVMPPGVGPNVPKPL